MANATITVLEADGVTQTDVVVLDVARQAAAASKSVALSTEDKAVLDSLATKLDTAITALQIIDNMVLAAGTANIGDVDVLTVPADPFGANADAASATGSISAKIRAIATALGVTALTRNAGASDANTLRVSVGLEQMAALATTAQAMSAGYQSVGIVTDQVKLPVQGNTAHDAVDADNPIKQGFKATTALSGLTLVADADRTNGFAGVDGVQIVRPHCNLEDIVSGNATNTDGTSTQCIAAQAAGIKTYLTSIVLCNTSATAITVDIKDGTTVKVSLPLPAGSGCVYNPPIPIPGTAATAWNFDGSAAATTVTCSMVGFKSKV